MAVKDYYKIIYIILSELFDCKETGKRLNVENVSPERFGIESSYLISIINDLLQEGHIRGVKVHVTKSGRFISGYENMEITRQGIDYLSNNTMMKKIYRNIKELRDWFPIIGRGIIK